MIIEYNLILYWRHFRMISEDRTIQFPGAPCTWLPCAISDTFAEQTEQSRQKLLHWLEIVTKLFSHICHERSLSGCGAKATTWWSCYDEFVIVTQYLRTQRIALERYVSRCCSTFVKLPVITVAPGRTCAVNLLLHDATYDVRVDVRRMMMMMMMKAHCTVLLPWHRSLSLDMQHIPRLCQQTVLQANRRLSAITGFINCFVS